MQVVCDVVISDLIEGIGKNSGKPYYRFKGVIVGCADMPFLSGTAFDKFISEEVYKELSTLTCDRFDCEVGLSKAFSGGQDFDLGLRLFINGFPHEETVEPPVDVSQPEALDKNKDKGGK